MLTLFCCLINRLQLPCHPKAHNLLYYTKTQQPIFVIIQWLSYSKKKPIRARGVIILSLALFIVLMMWFADYPNAVERAIIPGDFTRIYQMCFSSCLQFVPV